MHANIYLCEGHGSRPQQRRPRDPSEPSFQKYDQKNGKTKMIGSMGGNKAVTAAAAHEQVNLGGECFIVTGSRPRHERLDDAAGDLVGKNDRQCRSRHDHDTLPAKAVNKIPNQQGIEGNPEIFFAQPRHQEIEDAIPQCLVNEEKSFAIILKKELIQALSLGAYFFGNKYHSLRMVFIKWLHAVIAKNILEH